MYRKKQTQEKTSGYIHITYICIQAKRGKTNMYHHALPVQNKEKHTNCEKNAKKIHLPPSSSGDLRLLLRPEDETYSNVAPN